MKVVCVFARGSCHISCLYLLPCLFLLFCLLPHFHVCSRKTSGTDKNLDGTLLHPLTHSLSQYLSKCSSYPFLPPLHPSPKPLPGKTIHPIQCNHQKRRNKNLTNPLLFSLSFKIGGDNNLRVIVSKYDTANLRCYGKMEKPDAQDSCQGILDAMEAGDQTLIFGPREYEATEEINVGLPKVLISGMCVGFLICLFFLFPFFLFSCPVFCPRLSSFPFPPVRPSILSVEETKTTPHNIDRELVSLKRVSE